MSKGFAEGDEGMNRPPETDDLSEEIDLNDEISKAIDSLRSEAYYEQLDLSFRLQCCSEEICDDTKRYFFQQQCVAIIHEFEADSESVTIAALLEKITFRLYPKALAESEEKEKNKKAAGLLMYVLRQAIPLKVVIFLLNYP